MAGGSQAVNETAGEVRLCGSTRVRDWRSYGSFARHGGGSCLSWSLAGPPAPSFIDRLKSVVATPLCTSDCSVPVGLERTRRFDLRRAEDALGPVLDNMVSLLTTADRWDFASARAPYYISTIPARGGPAADAACNCVETA